jgi:hypothetical protein
MGVVMNDVGRHEQVELVEVATAPDLELGARDPLVRFGHPFFPRGYGHSGCSDASSTARKIAFAFVTDSWNS